MTQKEKFKEAKRLYKTANAEQKYLLESLFPELFVSEDERIRSEIIRYINLHKNDEKKSDEWIAWIGKQGDNKSKQDVYEQGYNDAIDKTCKFLNDKLPFYWALADVSNTDKFINLFIKAVKERQ